MSKTSIVKVYYKFQLCLQPNTFILQRIPLYFSTEEHLNLFSKEEIKKTLNP